MTFFLILVSLVSFVAGQVLLKMALNRHGDGTRRPIAGLFAASIFSMTVSFFISLGLLQVLDLSYLFPFQGFNVIITVVSSAVFLKERLSATLIVGAALITAGVILVSAS